MRIDPRGFEALVLRCEHGLVRVEQLWLGLDSLPEGDVLVDVAWSGINYKDALAVTGRGKIVREYPMVPGIDLAGTVLESRSPDFRPGDVVLVTGYGTGEDRWGGYAQLERTRSETLVHVPRGLSARQAMAIGTAGFTAMLSVMALEERGGLSSGSSVLVTGASGGVGSFAVALLAGRGYEVVASTGRLEMHDHLRRLGASAIVGRSELEGTPNRPLSSERWAGAVDSVGGDTLANILTALARHGSVACCGLAGGHQLATTVYPLILRGVSLIGIDSNYCPMPLRARAWEMLSRALSGSVIDSIAGNEVQLEDVPRACDELLAGGVRGRVLVKLRRSD